MIRAVIIDDEEPIRKATNHILHHIRPDVQVVGEGWDVKSAVETIANVKPELVFLDVELPDGTGFDVLEHLSPVEFKVVFITAYQEYAVKAFQFSAVDYIMKPVSASELASAIEKVIYLLQAEYSLKLNALINNRKTNQKHEKRIVLKSIDKMHILKLDEIVHCESDESYCNFYLVNGQKITVSKPLKEYDELLHDFDFLRVHKSHLINVDHIKRFDKAEGGYVIMTDESRIPVSYRKKDELLHILDNF